ncbi:LamG domain-containing protein [Kitasatospora sp. NBC_01250]|uniref:LamG-like jellyroll fold domain-containing protein n=1 Tax=Kitasatospora sp. NBC_01250 TaxID=2903571 RepID=UPI002E2F0E0C|nr:LamG-like jellyroll fold domain-containing protein [Kitasatospora sp. NBC_01250]
MLVVTLATNGGIATAGAAERGFPALSLPGWADMMGWFDGPPQEHWGPTPRQIGGSAAGRDHRADAGSTRAPGGAGHAPGKAPDQLDDYAPYQHRTAQGASATRTGYNAQTSKRDAAKSSRTTDAFDNADGSVTRDISQSPINYQDANGTWQKIDTSVDGAAGDGRYHEKANSLAVDFAAKAADSSLASFKVAGGHALSYGLQGAAPVAGTADGSDVSYPEILPGTDLTLTTTPTGLKESIVLRSAQAGNSWTFPLTLDGLTPHQQADGSIALTDAGGKTVEQIPQAYAWDSKVDPRSGDAASTNAVRYQLVSTAGGPALQVTLDANWLHSPDRQFPVTVDPTVTDGWTTAYAEDGNTGDHSYEQFLKIGSYDSGTTKANAFINHWDQSWDGSGVTVTSATLNLFDTWSSYCGAPARLDVAQVTQAWTPSQVSAYPGPSFGASIGNAAPTLHNACTNTSANPAVGDWVQVPLSTSALQGWMNGTTPDFGLAVYAATNDALHWKKFGSFMDPNKGPYMQVTYTGNAGPQVYEQYPNNNAAAYTTTPELTAWSAGANSTGASSTLKYDFTVYDNTNATVADSGQISTGDWVVPAGKLSWGKTYYWQVRSYDASTWSPSNGLYALNIQVPQPLITSSLSQNSSEHGFDASIGNYTTSDTDADVSTAGPPLEVVRDYNSRDPRYTGAFGAGWSSVFDSRATEQYNTSGALTGVVVTYPDGSQVGFGRNGDGSFSPPAGRFATLKSVTGGYTLTDKNDTVYTYTQSLGSGGYGVSSIADANNRAITYTWSGSQVTTMTSQVSGRALHLTWATPSGANAAHVATVATDPLGSSGALTWTYTYTGDQLTSLCRPTDAVHCASYGYGSGSQYQNATMDLGAQNYWPLSEASGSTATDAVLANEGNSNATYSNVTLGQTGGPLAGSTATVAGFNGSSSSVALPNNTGNATNSGALSLWFKTSAGPGVLYSYTSTPISAGSTSGYYTPSIYVGADGKLNAEFWYSGGVAPLTSSAAVTDGKWHHIVMSAAGNAQTLFLDNNRVGTLSGTVSIQSAVAFGANQPYNYIGAGYLGGSWPDQPNTGNATVSYFNGSIADVAWYNRPLVSADVNSLYQYGTHPASLLSSVTRPSGKALVGVGYDPATTAVTQVTDENGGVWKVGAPTVAGSSRTYRGAVLGNAPKDYWRLGDPAGSASATDEVRGGTATYSSVTLGAAGPFSDNTAASFNGSSSFVQLPATDRVSTSPGSVEMWFDMPAGNTAGGVLYDQMGQTLTGGNPTGGNWTPALYVGTDGKLYGKFWDTNGTGGEMNSPSGVNDGKWHHVLLAAQATGGQALYLDGTKVGSTTANLLGDATNYTYIGAGESGGGWPNHPTNTLGYFPGSIAEVAFHTTALSAQDDANHFAAGKNSTGLLPVKTVVVTDPKNTMETTRFDVVNGNRALSQTDGLGNTVSYGYDSGGFQSTVTDPNGVMSRTGHDPRGNAVSVTSCQNQQTNTCATQYFTYYPDDTTAQLTTADPRNDIMLTSRDGRSASATDNTYLTSFSYDGSGNELGVTTPAVPGFPSGRTTSTVYADGTATYPAADSGNVPKGLPMSTTSPGGAVNQVSYFHNGDVASTTNPNGLVTKYTYDALGRVLTKSVVSDTYPNGLQTSYVYDGDGQVTQEVNPALTDRVTGAVHTSQVSTVFDYDGDVTSQTVADTTGGDAPRTETSVYDAYDHVQSRTDANGNVSGATNGGTTTYAYDAMGEKVKEVGPTNVTTTYQYDSNGHLLTQTLNGYTGDPVNPSAATNLVESSRAYDPAGRLASITDSMGNTTSYTYTDNGLLATTTKTDSTGKNSFQLESNTYDAVGNLTQKTSNNGATVTQYQVDAASRVTSTTMDPTGADRVTQVSYTPDDLVATSRQTDSSGYDRTTSSTYDPMGNPTSQTLYGDSSGHPAGWWPLNQTSGSTVTDASGNGYSAAASGKVTWSGGAANFDGSGGTISTNGPVLNTASSYTVSAWVNLADNTAYHSFVTQAGTNVPSFYLQYSKAFGGWAFIANSSDATSPSAYYSAHTSSAALNTWTHLVGTFDSSTGTMSLYVNGSLAATGNNPSPWSGTGGLTIGASKTPNNGTFDIANGQVSNVQVYQRAVSATEAQTLYTNGRNGGTVGSSNTQTTNWTYDKRGMPASVTDPNGNTTQYTYDEAGNLAVTTAPAVPVEAVGGTSVTAHPVTTSGFNTFGEAVEELDPNGNETTTAYDADGQKVSQTLPNYTPPGATSPVGGQSSWTYDAEGNVLSTTRPGGETTQVQYTQLGDVAQVTAADNSTVHSVYDTNGEKLSVTDGTGAVTQATYDWLGRTVTGTQLERYPSTQTLTSTQSYAVTPGNPYGAFLSSQTSATGVSTSYGYNRLGEQTSVTDAANNTTTSAYDFEGRPYKTTAADGTYGWTDYTAAGLPADHKQFDANNNLLTQTSAVYDGNGNATAVTDANGHTSQLTYDASNMVTQEVQPVSATSSITTSFGYDAAGQRTRYTDGRNNSWLYTYTPRGQLASEQEPATAVYTAASDSTTTYAYDADGRATSQTLPGGVSLSFGYDKLDQLLSASGTGAEAATASRSFTYDNAGRVLTAGTAVAGTMGNPDYQTATNEAFTYNDRGSMLTASGSAGASSFAYNGAGQLTSRTDAAGTTGYGYDSAGRLQSVNDPATGTQLTYGYNNLNQVSSISYGTLGDVRTYGYDNLHRLSSDTLAKGTTTLASIAYGYDNNNNLTSKNTAGVAGAANNTYTYDWANRLTSWNNGTTNTPYAYDASGNRIQSGSNVFTYDARDQLTSDGVHTYTYAARGTMTHDITAAGSTAMSSDAYGQQVVAGTQSYTHDATGRNITDTTLGGGATRTFQYSGVGNVIASDGDYTYTYDDGDSLVGMNNAGATSTSTGQLAMLDQHNDVVGTFAPTATTLATSATYDPLGSVVSGSNLAGHLGFQSGWTENSTNLVGTASRWYNPRTGEFLNKDTVSLNAVPNSAAANLFAYVADNPLSAGDPSGNCWGPAVFCKVGHAIAHDVSSGYHEAASAVSSGYHAVSSAVSSGYHAVSSGVSYVAHATASAARSAYHHVSDAYHRAYHYVQQVHRYAVRTVRRVYHAAVHVVKQAYHVVKQAAKRVVHAASKAVGVAYRATRTAYHATVSAAKTAAKFVKHHAAAITSFVVSTAVFAGCEAVTAGVGTIGCAAAAGAAGNLVNQGFKCAQKGGSACSVSAFGKTAVEGAVEGAAGGALGELGGAVLGKVAPKAMEAVGGLFGKGATSAADSATEDVTAQAAHEAEAQGAKSAADSCLTHSFTGATPVLMANGTTKRIDQIKIGDQITNGVPGKDGTQSHTVTNVIVTTTDHDFADVTVTPLHPGTTTKETATPTRTTEAVPAKATVGSLSTKLRHRAGLTLAASIAAATSLLGLNPQPATAATPAAQTVSSASTSSTTESTDTTDPAIAAGGGTLHTTFHHPFYDETRSAFVDAQDLHAGDVLQTPTGTAQVTDVHLFHANTTTYDLTIGDLHTYFVEAGDTPVLVHNCDPVLQGRYKISEAQKRSNVGFRYQEHVTGTDEEQWWQHNGQLIKVDGGPDADGFITEAKWTGNDHPNAWGKSLYNPSHSRTVFNEDTTVDQARRLLGLNSALGGSGVRYAVSNAGGAAFYRAVFREWFPEEMESGALRVFHVSAAGMK